MSNGNNISGVKTSVNRNTGKSVELLVNGSMYVDCYMNLDGTAKHVINAILKYMGDDSNLIQIGGDTLNAIIELTEYNEGTIRKAMVRLNKFGLAEKTNLRGEYIVNPSFAVKGNEKLVWDTYGSIENSLKEYREDNDRFVASEVIYNGRAS